MTLDWTFRPGTREDADWMAELRARVMRPDLERLGVFSETRVRERFLTAFAPAHTRVIVVDGRDAGLVALRPGEDGLWIEHFSLRPEVQGRGIGAAVFAALLADPVDQGATLRLNVLQGSPARRLYERHGFVLDSEDAVDVYLRRDLRDRPSPGEGEGGNPDLSPPPEDIPPRTR
ncbi:GNAT family N-acetyltransferase [Leucobacter sp. CSA2]|uniref:GNAT family N-acetyltransferase n=1 Tax=Leucobacter edaphi TaxID=2796472 RepID=A0A934UXC9_9MICO|nr:GNAT family N-acetyltransferase [Leucobacter edaphi]MBK0420797.1 GNAT family N-acetyltransferase [Leucobacter edaphi]